MAHEEKIEKLKELIKIQKTDGNWNHSEYMYGMLNGLICALSVFEGGHAEYVDRPDLFISDINDLDKFNKSAILVCNTKKKGDADASN